MPALPAVPNVLRLDHYFHIAEDLTAKTRKFWKYLGGPPTNAELATMATAVRTAFASDMASLLSSFWELSEIVVTDLSSSTAAQGSDSTAVPGTRSGSSNSASVCLLESLKIGRRYRGGHPRNYWPFGVNGDFATAQTWLPAFITACDTGFTSFHSAIDSAIGAWGTSEGQVNVSYYSGFTTHTGTTGRVRNVSTVRLAPLVDAATGVIFQVGIASQRKRLLKLA